MSSSGVGCSESDDSWGDEWADDQPESYQSLFDSTSFSTVHSVMQHDRVVHSFDILQYKCKHELDQIGVIRCINFMRDTVRSGQDPRPLLEQGPTAFSEEKFLLPVIDNDALLCYDFEDHSTEGEPADSTRKGNLCALQAQNESLLACLAEMRLQMMPEELQTDQAPSQSHCNEEIKQAVVADERANVDDAYFDSYSYMDIHREMLSDHARTGAYQKAIEGNPRLFNGAVVVDVGCGTGILSMFACRSGATRVHAIDAAARIAQVAAEASLRNQMDASCGGPLTVHTGKVEDVVIADLRDGQADILISEWMGYALLFESMLASVLVARDRWLRPGGAILPDKATLFLAAGDGKATTLDFWDDVYGLNFSHIKEALLKETLKHPVVTAVPAGSLISGGAALHTFHLSTMTMEDIDFTDTCSLHVNREGVCHCVILWFDTPFSENICEEMPVTLTTSPLSKQTHWAQTVFLLESPIAVAKGDLLKSRMSFAQGKLHRSLDIALELTHEKQGQVVSQCTALYVMQVSSSNRPGMQV